MGGRPASVEEAAAADLVCVAVKPKDAADALPGIARAMAPGAVLLSVIAGWDLDRLAAAAPGAGLARTMPNLAVRHGAGVVALATRGLDPGREAELTGFLRPLGAVVPLPEGLFAPATALAGSGPGLLALVAEGLEEGAVAAGLARPQARELTAAVLAGHGGAARRRHRPGRRAAARQLPGRGHDRRPRRPGTGRGAGPHRRRGSRGGPEGR